MKYDKMQIRIGDFEITEVWDGVFYKKLSDFPNITEWEIRTILDFMDYENSNGRPIEIDEIQCENLQILQFIKNAVRNKTYYKNISPPEKITECTACPTLKGCMTKFVLHTTSIENAIKIFSCGKLLSAVNARKLPACILENESRNAANDPKDYFDYIMFSWGNCQAGDRLVMERKLNRFPDDKDLSVDFTPGVRFYFEYDKIIKHPNATFDGVLPLKIKDELILANYIFAVIIPEREKNSILPYIPKDLENKVHIIKNDCRDIWEWTEKVYHYLEKL